MLGHFDARAEFPISVAECATEICADVWTNFAFERRSTRDAAAPFGVDKGLTSSKKLARTRDYFTPMKQNKLVLEETLVHAMVVGLSLYPE
jgi:hypothetical protein